MYAFFHILIGLLIGIGLSNYSPKKGLIPICMLVSILPDIIDKPLAYLSAELSSGRTVSHTLLFIGIVTLVLWYLLSKDNRVFVVGISASLLIHQIIDRMWLTPTTWYYPALGPFQMEPGKTGDWLLWLFQNEIGSPVEWVSAGIIVVILLYMHSTKDKATDLKVKNNQSLWQVLVYWLRGES